ncbi:MAG: hypothetical protein ONB12_13445, partial [candidate division KSB1 bacterium]|nr:hypothetical protein [candidate division KSB1 bacterium]
MVGKSVIISLFVLIMIAADGLQARSFYLHPFGSDGGKGTLDSPWRTLDRLKAAAPCAGDSIFLFGGA